MGKTVIVGNALAMDITYELARQSQMDNPNHRDKEGLSVDPGVCSMNINDYSPGVSMEPNHAYSDRGYSPDDSGAGLGPEEGPNAPDN